MIPSLPPPPGSRSHFSVSKSFYPFRPSSFVIWISILLLAGCAVGPNYHRLPLNLPAEFRGAPVTQTNSLADLPWWNVFPDQTLQELIREALTNNYDLRIA